MNVLHAVVARKQYIAVSVPQYGASMGLTSTKNDEGGCETKTCVPGSLARASPTIGWLHGTVVQQIDPVTKQTRPTHKHPGYLSSVARRSASIDRDAESTDLDCTYPIFTILAGRTLTKASGAFCLVLAFRVLLQELRGEIERH